MSCFWLVISDPTSASGGDNRAAYPIGSLAWSGELIHIEPRRFAAVPLARELPHGGGGCDPCGYCHVVPKWRQLQRNSIQAAKGSELFSLAHANLPSELVASSGSASRCDTPRTMAVRPEPGVFRLTCGVRAASSEHRSPSPPTYLTRRARAANRLLRLQHPWHRAWFW